MNRSLSDRIKRACRADGRRSRWGYRDGEAEIVAVFPKGFFGIQDPFELPGGVPSQTRPVARGLWWRPEDVTRPLWDGTAIVALEGWTSDGRYAQPHMPDRVYTCVVRHDEEGTAYPDLHDLMDKPHRVRNVEHATFSEEPALFQAAHALFDVVGFRSGFVPCMYGWLWGFYDEKWFLPIRYEPGDKNMYDDETLRWLVNFLDGLRAGGASIRVYKRVDRYRTGSPHWFGSQDAHFLKLSMDARVEGDTETWKLFGRDVT